MSARSRRRALRTLGLLTAAGGAAVPGAGGAGLLLALGGCAAPGPPAASPPRPTAAGSLPVPVASAAPLPMPAADGDEPPPEPREFRAAWVATVSNIDWPSAPGLPPAQQRREALALLDRAVAIGLNALVLQVRPAGDALYASALEPWSEFLTGRQGRAPDPPWDPLAFWVHEAHARGLELHAWFNPFRARTAGAKSPLAPPHLAAVRPEAARRYGELLWFDPGEPAAVARLLAVVEDVLRRYDVDGIHLDDYFYPYPVSMPGTPASGAGAGTGTGTGTGTAAVAGGGAAPARTAMPVGAAAALEPGAAAGGLPATAGAVPEPAELPFPDDDSYARYRLGGGPLAREDWRRANVDALVRELYARVRAVRPSARLGISPFGVGRPDRRPPGVIGFSQYDKLYADVERWLAEGWLDYLAPQLYWTLAREGLQFPVLLDYWVQANPRGRHVWPGLYTSLVTRLEPGQAPGPRAWPAREVLEQIAVQRTRGPTAAGHLHFSMSPLMQDRDGIATLLRSGAYAQPALVPATPWLAGGRAPPPALRLSARAGGQAVAIEPVAGAEPPWRIALWQRAGGRWRLAVLPGAQRQADVAGADLVVARAVDRIGQAGARTRLVLSAADPR